MALKVWLPLNGDLKNQGTSNVNVTSNYTSVDNAGKIGQCLKITNQIDLNYQLNFNITNFTISGWFKFNKSEIQTALSSKTYTSTARAATGNLIGNNNYGGVGIIWTSNDMYASNKVLNDIVIQAIFRVGSSVTSYTIGHINDTNDNWDKWIHLCIVFDRETNILKCYQDGQIKVSNSVPAFSDMVLRNLFLNYGGVYGGNGPSAVIPFRINDIRIYDNALSLAEVKKISKGLVCHYKLNGTGALPNLFRDTFIESKPTVSNSSEDWTKYIRYYNGSSSVHSVENGIDTITLNVAQNMGIAFQRKATDIELDPNSYYTVSCEAKTTKIGGQLSMGRSYYSTSNAWVWRGGYSPTSFNATNTWQKFSWTFKPDADTQYIMYCFTMLGTNGGTDTLSIKNCKLEKNSTATSWIPNKNDNLYTILGYNSNIIVDCSGNGYNGTLTGTPEIIKSSTKYGTVTHITDTAQYILTPVIYTIGFGNTYSISWWSKVPSFYCMQWGFINGIRLNGIYYGNLWNTGDGSNNPIYYPGTTTQVSSPAWDTWHHFVMTGDGTNCKLYVDGELYGVAKTYKAISGTQIVINGWSTDTSYSYNDLSISDFRLYSTCLSAEDIKELYQIVTRVDKLGKAYCYELQEG